MEWNVPFVVYRISGSGKLEEVYQAQELKKAKYWLTYIALPGDVLCITPTHPKHSGKSRCPEYWSHKAQSGSATSKEEEWRLFAKTMNLQESFPEEQMSTQATQ